jgi:hypothetical protein
MFDHVLPNIRLAAHVLSSQDSPLQVRLVEAGNALWATMSYPEEWPIDLRQKANCLVDRLLEGGSVQTTVAQMDVKTVNDVSRKILNLAAEAETARSERLYPVE